MFTGIIEEVGKIKQVNPTSLEIEAKTVLEDTKIGDSISVNGVCLTVINKNNDSFTADVMPETLRRSSLGDLKRGSHINLERAMPANGRFGGHIVSGHIDGTGTVSAINKEGNAHLIKIKAGPDLLKYIVSKGSIAIDGISLTVADVTDSDFTVSIIPHTGSETTLLNKQIGEQVNLENDVLSKYVEKLLNFPKTTKSKNEDITLDFLRSNGF